MKFNPNEYETVKSRKERFRRDHPDGRITVELITGPERMDSHVAVHAYVYKNVEDQEKGLAFGEGMAYEERETELSESKSGRKYESVNYTSWTENCEESAVGRALDNAGYSGNKKCSREEMEKAQRMTRVSSEPASGKQIKYLKQLVEDSGEEFANWLSQVNIGSEEEITKSFASKAISKLSGK